MIWYDVCVVCIKDLKLSSKTTAWLTYRLDELLQLSVQTHTSNLEYYTTEYENVFKYWTINFWRFWGSS